MRNRNKLIAQLIPEPVFLSLTFRISGLFLLYVLCQVLFYLVNHAYFRIESAGQLMNWFWGGLVFDAVAIFYVNILYIFLATLPLRIRYWKGYQLVLTIIFVATNAFALAGNVIDVFYYPFTLTRTTASVFRQFSHETNMVILFIRFMRDYWYGTLFFVLLVAGLIYFARLTRPRKSPTQRGVLYYGYALVLLLITYTLFVGAVRGGYKHSTRPITLSNAGQYVKRPNEVSVVLNTPFCILKTWGIKTFTKVDYMPQEKADSLFPLVHVPSANQTMNKKNVVIFIMESFGKEFFGFYNKDQGKNYKSYTPFLDSLCSHSLTFRYSYANGRKSIDALPSVLVSIPSMVEPFVTTECFSDNMQSLPYLLDQEGYLTAFFHGAPNGSMGYLAFTNLIGVNRYYGLNEYGNNNDFDGYWAIWDEEFFQYFARTLNGFTQPFLATIFSATSHHPFVLPARYAGKFPEGPHPINRCIGYSDMALRKFFKTASREPWYKNTIFVLTADHCQSQPQKDIYRSSTGSFEVPILFYTPDDSLQREDNHKLIQQIDIMPVILGLLKYNKPYFAFGADVLHEKGDHCVVNYIDGIYQLFHGDYVIQADLKKTRGIYKYKTDRLLKNNLTGKVGLVQDTLEWKIRAFIQQYNNRMLENKISLP